MHIFILRILQRYLIITSYKYHSVSLSRYLQFINTYIHFSIFDIFHFTSTCSECSMKDITLHFTEWNTYWYLKVTFKLSYSHRYYFQRNWNRKFHGMTPHPHHFLSSRDFMLRVLSLHITRLRPKLSQLTIMTASFEKCEM